MLVLMIEPGKAPRRLELNHRLEEMQKAVGGSVQILYPFGEPVALVCNEEGKLMGLEGNRRVGNDIIAGTFFLAGDTSTGDFCSLTEEQLERFQKLFAQPESFQPGEVEDALRVEFYSM